MGERRERVERGEMGERRERVEREREKREERGEMGEITGRLIGLEKNCLHTKRNNNKASSLNGTLQGKTKKGIVFRPHYFLEFNLVKK